MKAYFLTNSYLSSIQHGIQSLHCLQEINNHFAGNQILDEWATIHKTAIILNGGTSDTMKNILELFQHTSNPYPYGYFHEPSMDNLLTCVGIIVPSTLYSYERSDYGTIEHEISTILRSKRFAK